MLMLIAKPVFHVEAAIVETLLLARLSLLLSLKAWTSSSFLSSLAV